jgi:hypothetical protein
MAEEDQTMQVDDGAQPAKVVRVNYPGNSNKTKQDREAQGSSSEKRVEKVITGEAHERKKGLGRKIAETFAGDRIENVGNYVLFDVVLPQIKSLVSDVVTQSIERALFGDNTRSRYASRGGSFGNNRSGNGYVSYNRFSSPSGRGSEQDAPRQGVTSPKRGGDFRDIVLDNRGDADAVLDGMSELISKYDVVSVSDLNEMVGVTGEFTDEKWGWFNIRGAQVRRLNGGGYILDLPRPEPIDKR